MNTLSLLLQAQPAANGGLMQIGLILILILIFYFFIMRPQSKKQKELQKAREALKAGDKVITAGGIYGTIKEVNETTKVVTVEVWDGVKFKIDLNSLYAVNDAAKK